LETILLLADRIGKKIANKSPLSHLYWISNAICSSISHSASFTETVIQTDEY